LRGGERGRWRREYIANVPQKKGKRGRRSRPATLRIKGGGKKKRGRRGRDVGYTHFP